MWTKKPRLRIAAWAIPAAFLLSSLGVVASTPASSPAQPARTALPGSPSIIRAIGLHGGRAAPRRAQEVIPPFPAGIGGAPGQGKTGDGDGGADEPLQAANWFQLQRAYPLAAIPTGAHDRALSQVAALRRATLRTVSAPSTDAPLAPGMNAAWLHVGDAGQQTGGSATTDFGGGPVQPRNNGPVGGRVTALAVDPTNANTIYAGTALGGVWKTTDGGQTWAAKTDSQASLAIGALAIDPTTPRTIYALTGEGNYSTSYYGGGLLKSSDAGETWTRVSTALTGLTASRLIVDPHTPQTLYAAIGRGICCLPWTVTASGIGGIYRSTDGGVSWSLVLNPSSSLAGGCADAAGTPVGVGSDLAVSSISGVTVIYAALGSQSGCTANGIYRSTNAGQSWQRLTNPDSSLGRIALDTTPADPNVVYAAIQLADPGQADQGYLGGVFKSVDRGASWSTLNLPDDVKGYDQNGVPLHPTQYNYDFYVAVDPTSPETAYIGGLDIFKTADSGQTWTNTTNVYGSPAGQAIVHPDQHALVFASDGSLYAGNDGGVWGSTDGASTWSNRNGGLEAIQLYGMAVSRPEQGLVIYRGAQDNSNSRYGGSGAWTTVVDGDGTLAAIDPTNSRIAYAGHPNASLFKTTDDGATWALVAGVSSNPSDPASDGRQQFVTPFVIDQTQPRRLLMGTYRLWESTNGGSSWAVTGTGQDLTGGRGTVTTLAIAPSAPNTVYAGTRNGRVQATMDDGGSWVNGAGLPGRWVTSLAVDPANALRAWAGVSGFNVATPSTPGHIFATTDGGHTWHDASGNLPDVPVNALAIDGAGTVYAGTDVGVLASTDNGATWTLLGTGLPNVAVFALVARADGVLYAATHGRGVWSLTVGLPPATPTSTTPPTATPTNTVPPTSTPIPTATTVPPTSTPIPPAPTAPPVSTPLPPAPTAPPVSTPIPPAPTATTVPAPAPASVSATPVNAPLPGLPTPAPSTPGAAPVQRVGATATPQPSQNQPVATAAPVLPAQHPGTGGRTNGKKQSTRPPLALSLAPGFVVSGGALTIGIVTASGARVGFELRVATTKIVATGKGKHIKHTTRITVLYHVSGQGAADKHGRFSGRVRVAYAPTKPTLATLTVIVSTRSGTTTHTVSVTIKPAQRRR